MEHRRRSTLALLLTVLAVSTGAGAFDTPDPDLAPTEARADGPLHADEPSRVLVRVENLGADAVCDVVVRVEVADASAQRSYTNHAARTVAEVTLDLPAIPEGTHAAVARVEHGGCRDERPENDALEFQLVWRPRTAVAATLAASPTSGRAPLDVAFSLAAPGAESWTIAFGDGATASGEGAPPSVLHHRYTETGALEATLTARTGTEEASARADLTVAPPLPARTVTLAARPSEGVAPLDVGFAASGATDAVRWRIDFGDGTHASGDGAPPPIRHTYSTTGDVQAKLEATFPDVSVDASTAVRVLSPAAVAPLVAISASPLAGTAPLRVTVAPVATDAASWRLVWGDGVVASGEGPAPAELAHAYTLPGTYRLLLEARSRSGVAAAATAAIVVDGPGLDPGHPFLEADSTQGHAPLRVVLRGGCTCRDVLAWRVTFGDGAEAWGEGAPPAIPHEYGPGRHLARLQLTTLRGVVEPEPLAIEVAGVDVPRLVADASPGALRLAIEVPRAERWELSLDEGREWTGVGPVVLDVPASPGPHAAQLSVEGLVADRAVVEVPEPFAPLLVAEPPGGAAPLATRLLPRAIAGTLHWALEFGDGKVASGVGEPPASIDHTYAHGQHTARLVLVTAWGATRTAIAKVDAEAPPPRLDVSARPLLLVVEGEAGALTVDGRPAAAFADAALQVPAPNSAGVRYVPCAPGERVVRLATPTGVAERRVVCPAPTEASRRDVELPPEPPRGIPVGGALAAAFGTLAVALRGRRGAAIALAALAISAGASAKFPVVNSEESHESTTAGDWIRIRGLGASSIGNLAVLAPDGTALGPGNPVNVPAGLALDGWWTVVAQARFCDAPDRPHRVEFSLAGRVNGVTTAVCANPVVWSFYPTSASGTSSSYLLGARLDGDGVGAPASIPTFPDWWVFSPWGPRDYETMALAPSLDQDEPLSPSHRAILATVTDYDADGTPTTGELARGECALSGTRACPLDTPAAEGFDGLDAEIAWDGPLFATVPARAELRVAPPSMGALTRVDVTLPAGWAVDPAATEAPTGWTLSVAGDRLAFRLRAPERTDPTREAREETFRLAVIAGGAGEASLLVDAASAFDAHPGARALLPVAVELDASPPVVAHDAPQWASGDVDVKLAATDAESGVALLRHREAGGAWVASDTFRLPLAGPSAGFEWEARDRAGNVATGTGVVERDAQAPSLSFSPAAGLRDGPFTVSPVASDDASGLVEAGVRIGGGAFEAAVTIVAEGEYEVEAQARDLAGNVATSSATYVLSIPQAARLSTAVEPAVVRPGESAIVSLSVENLRDYALADVRVRLAGEETLLGSIAPRSTASASFTVTRAADAALEAWAEWRTPWRTETATAPVEIDVEPLRSLRLLCLSVAGSPGADAHVPCAVVADGDADGLVRLEAGSGSVEATVERGRTVILEVPIPPLVAGRSTIVVRATGDAGLAETTLVAAGVVARALLLDGAILRNLGDARETTPLGSLGPGETATLDGLRAGFSGAAADGHAGTRGAFVRGPGSAVAIAGLPFPTERGDELSAVREGETILVRDAAGPLAGALVGSGGQVGVTGPDGAATVRGPTVEVRYGSRTVALG